ncbi:hypothetical protein HPB48_018974 [Haemaphysalis longicornis]|uniref:Nlr family card domain protein n=1 Tax=Haemaphysalis longicornis TaxID=44386 RepID=A0A9J6FWT6_HAELO|nr:hypothetical protein HPB48_018974 [Haemaphysalis longicornis]
MAPRTTLLRSYALKIKEICPELPSADTLVRKFRSPVTGFGDHHLTFPIMCTTKSGSEAGQVCPVFREIALWNELLALVNMELIEVAPGRLNAARLPGTNRIIGKPQDIQRAAVCVHWLLVEHKCVEAIEPTGRLFDNYPQLFIDALARSSSVKSVRLSGHVINVDVAIDLFSRTSKKIQIEEMHLDNLEFLGDKRKLQESLVLWLQTLASLKSLKLTRLCGHWDADWFANALQLHAGISTLTVDVHLVVGVKKVFSAFLTSNTALTELVLIGRGFQGHCDANSVLEALGNNSALQKLSFHDYSFDVVEATQLSDALAANTTIEEVTLIRCSWDFFAHTMSRWEFRRGRLEDAKRRWGLWWRVDPFVNAIRNSASLRKLYFDTNHFLDAELTRLLQAAQDRNSFRELHFDQLVRPSVGEFWSLIENSGASGKVKIGTFSSKSELFADGLDVLPTLLSIEQHAFYDLSSAHMFNICGALTSNDCISILHLILTDSQDTVSEQCAIFLAVYLASTASLKEVHFHFDATGDAVHIITVGLAKNKSLERLSIQGLDVRRDDAFAICDWLRQSRTVYQMKWLCIFGCQTANDIIWKLSETLQNSYTLTSLRVDYFCPSNPQWQQVKNIVRRNSALVERAAHFVLGARTRICAAAYETMSWHPLVLRKVAKLASVGEEEARQKLTEAEQALQNDFWRLSGVVKEELACENLNHGEVQIDGLGMDAWLTVRKFLNVSDIVDAKPILKQTRSQKANIKY